MATPTDEERAALRSTTAVAAKQQSGIAGIWSSNDMGCGLSWNPSGSSRVTCWGYAQHPTSRLVSGSSVAMGDEIGQADNWATLAVGSHHACGLSTLGEVMCVRRNGGTVISGPASRLGEKQAISIESTFRPLTTQYATALAARENATCAITADRRVACWNHGSDGKFDAPKVVMGGAAAPLANVMTVAVGGSHRCAVVGTATSAEVRCWGGANNVGQLGYAGTGSGTDTASTAVPGVTPVLRARAMLRHTVTDAGEVKVKATLVSPTHSASDGSSTFSLSAQ